MKYGFEWTPGLVLLGMVVILPLAPPFAMIAVAMLALAAVAAVVALAGAVLAAPYLLFRHLHRHSPEPLPTPDSRAAIVGIHMGVLAEDPS